MKYEFEIIYLKKTQYKNDKELIYGKYNANYVIA